VAAFYYQQQPKLKATFLHMFTYALHICSIAGTGGGGSKSSADLLESKRKRKLCRC